MAKSPLIAFVLYCAFLAIAAACNKFEKSPYDTRLGNELPSALNARNLAELVSRNDGDRDTVCFVFTGDSQRFYEELEDLVAKVNTLPGVHFLALAGDITDFGLAKEFKWIYERLEKLDVPYLCVIGNHDLTGNGPGLYDSIFGPRNFSFVFKGTKFIFHDTNGREYGFNATVPDLSYIRAQLQDPVPGQIVAISHVPPFNEDFDPAVKQDYIDVLRSDPRLLLSMHGHLHGTKDTVMYAGHVRYIVTPAVQKREAFIIKIHQGKVYKQTIAF